MVVGSNPALKPVMNIHMPCAEAHLGICRTRDAEILGFALAMARLIHHEVSSLPAGSFFAFHTHRYSKVFVLCVKRYRDPELCVFADCEYLDVLPKPEIEVIIKDDELVFETSYSIARDLTLSSNEVGAEITIT